MHKTSTLLSTLLIRWKTITSVKCGEYIMSRTDGSAYATTPGFLNNFTRHFITGDSREKFLQDAETTASHIFEYAELVMNSTVLNPVVAIAERHDKRDSRELLIQYEKLVQIQCDIDNGITGLQSSKTHYDAQGDNQFGLKIEQLIQNIRQNIRSIVWKLQDLREGTNLSLILSKQSENIDMPHKSSSSSHRPRLLSTPSNSPPRESLPSVSSPASSTSSNSGPIHSVENLTV